MAILPEEFPVVLTVFLALGAWRISRHGVLTRRMPAIETLGAATVLCVDKTGTLTENRMALVDTIAPAATPARVLEAAALACELDPFDPMERAILAAAGACGRGLRRTLDARARLSAHAEFLAVCHAWRSPQGERRVAIKGAPETVLALCRLDRDARRDGAGEVERSQPRGLRLLAVARGALGRADWPDGSRALPASLARLRRARRSRCAPTVPEAIAQCRGAGVRVVMITGDYPGTALRDRAPGGHRDRRRRADRRGDRGDGRRRARAGGAARQRLRAHPARAEAAARHGLQGRRRSGGDDRRRRQRRAGAARPRTSASRWAGAAPTSRARPPRWCCSRTISARSSHAVRLGRRIYDNIRNAMRYMIAVHVPIAGMSFLPLVFGWPVFLFPVHVVFLEFVIDPACSIVFEAERDRGGRRCGARRATRASRCSACRCSA